MGRAIRGFPLPGWEGRKGRGPRLSELGAHVGIRREGDGFQSEMLGTYIAFNLQVPTARCHFFDFDDRGKGIWKH
jgi:hypothetical protein